MKRYTITVNGKAYDVQVEEAGASAPAAAAPAPAVPAPTPAPAPAAAPAPAPAVPAPAPAAAPAGAVAVNAPMPGNILDVRVTEGAAVKKGDILVILEAMKMENEIMAPQDGVVTGLAVRKGDTVNSNDRICSLA